MAKRTEYSPEFKREAVRLADNSSNKSAVARQLGIHSSMIRRWKIQLEADGDRAFPWQGPCP